MMRRFSQVSFALTCGSTHLSPKPAQNTCSFGAQQLRRIADIVFSAQSPDLMAVQKERGFKSDVWFRRDFPSATGVVAVKKGEKTTWCSIKQRMKYINLDDIEGIPADVRKEKFPPTITEHYEMMYLKPLHASRRFELDDIMTLNGYHTKWWMAPKQVFDQGYRLHRAAKTHVITPLKPVALFNQDQLQAWCVEGLMKTIFSGHSGAAMFFSKESNSQLQAFTKKMGYPTGVYFTKQGVDTLGLEMKDPSNLCSMGKNQAEVIYNLTEFKDWEEIAIKAHERKRLRLTTSEDRAAFPTVMDLLPDRPQFLEEGPVKSERAVYLIDLLMGRKASPTEGVSPSSSPASNQSKGKGKKTTLGAADAQVDESQELFYPQTLPKYAVNIWVSFAEMRSFGIEGTLKKNAIQIPQLFLQERFNTTEKHSLQWVNIDELSDVEAAKSKVGAVTGYKT